MTGLHVPLAAAALGMSLWTLHIDINHTYGWQGGGWLFKFTHWSYICTVSFLAVSLSAGLAGGGATSPLAAARRALLFLALVLALGVDLGFFAIIFPARVSGRDKDFTGRPLSPTSAHKHLINLLWILADAGAYDYSGVGAQQLSSEFVAFGVVLPLVVASLYYALAAILKNEERGTRLLQRLKVSLPTDVDGNGVVLPSFADLPATEWGNRTALPGRWIYSSFSHKGARIAFVAMTPVYSALAAALLLGAQALMGSRISVQALLLVVILSLTPAIYAPGVVRRNRASVGSAQAAGLAILEVLHAGLSAMAAGARNFASAEILADSRELAGSFADFMATEARRFFDEIAAALDHARSNRRSQRRKKEAAEPKKTKRDSARSAKRASIDSLASTNSIK